MKRKKWLRRGEKNKNKYKKKIVRNAPAFELL